MGVIVSVFVSDERPFSISTQSSSRAGEQQKNSHFVQPHFATPPNCTSTLAPFNLPNLSHLVRQPDYWVVDHACPHHCWVKLRGALIMSIDFTPEVFLSCSRVWF